MKPLKVTALFLLVNSTIYLSGCAVPLLLGVKEYKDGDMHVKFITGADFTVGANGTDTVDNRRGISPKELR